MVREQRKTVTVIFCDVAGSTSLGESHDPEALRALLARYFARMKAIVEAHGGTVEKFIGDAVMAVFGIPHVHEDDALRAVRAALEMRDAMPALGIEGRIGINTGEVVTGTAERLATGDAVNIAARLQQAAAPQEILIGRDTHELVATVVDAAAVGPLTLKGKAQPVAAFRLGGLLVGQVRRTEAPMVGRDTERRRLRDAYRQAVSDRSCQLFTIMGNAGVGKSRLVHEFLDDLDAAVVRGVCLAYGEGITYWPVTEVIRELVQLRPALTLNDDLASLLRQEPFTAPSEQVAWSFRKLLEETARERPLVVVFDDLQWAEAKFLDLIEHVADLSRDAPLLVLCMARPDLLDRRPTWAGGKLNATTLLLEPLSAGESAEMVTTLVRGLSEAAQQRVIDAAEGNPLFVEEMLALVRDSGDENIRVPPTIHALLAARLDQLEEHERKVLERGSIEGRLFHRGAVEALYPEEPQVATRLTALVRKDLVRPDKPELPGEDAFRFRHLLIRDAAYEALPKATRADLHERFARWLEEFGADLPELDEILGYHLEQAVRYRLELGEAADAGLAARARQRLAAAGRRALTRGDQAAAQNLLRRADALPGDVDVTIQHDEMISALFGATSNRTLEVAQGHLDRALAAGDRGAELCSQMELEFIRTFQAPTGTEYLAALAEEASRLFEATGNLRGMYAVYLARGQVANLACDVSAVMANFESATEVSRRLGLGNEFIAQRANWRLPSAEPNSKTLAWFATEAAGYHAGVDHCHAEAQAMAGRFEAAQVLLQNDLKLAEAMGGPMAVGSIIGFEGARIAFMAGDYDGAVAAGEQAVPLVEELGNTSIASTIAGILARSCFYAGRLDDAARWSDRATALAAAEDVYTRLLVLQARGLVAAQRGDAGEARRWHDQAARLAETTHSPTLLADAYFDTGKSLELLGEQVEAIAAYQKALALYEAKEYLVLAERTRGMIADLTTRSESHVRHHPG